MTTLDLRSASVLVTGATGFIGSHLLPRLLRVGARVSVLSRDPERARRAFGTEVRCEREPDRLAADAPQIVINLAGAGIAERPWTRARRKVLLDSRVAFTDALRTSLAKAPPSVLVNASAVGYYGVSESREFSEEDGPGSGFAAELCRRWEDSAEAFTGLGTRVVRLRIGLVLGPGGLLQRMKLPFSLGLGGRIGHGRQWMSWVHLDDVLGLIETAVMETSMTGAVNAVAPNPVTNAEFTRTLGRVLGRPTLLPVPAFALRTLLGDMAEELLLSGVRAHPNRALASGYAFEHPELEGAMRAALGRGRSAA